MGRNKKTFLVTGATGFVGANLCRRLINKDVEVHILTRHASNRWRLTGVLSRLHDHKVDLREFEKLKRVIDKIKPTHIFHLASVTANGVGYLEREELVESNFLGTLNLINACEEINYESFISTGSSSEYGPKTKPMKENDLCEPSTFYGASKLAATLYGQVMAQTKNRPIVSLRLFSPFGPLDDRNKLMAYAITRALKNRPLNLASPSSARDYIHIDDVIDSYLFCLKDPDAVRGEIINIGSGRQITVREAVEKILKFSKSKSRVKWHTFAGRFYDTSFWQADIDKARTILGWQPKLSFDERLQQTIDWFRGNMFLYRNS